MYGNNVLGRVKKFGRSNTYNPFANNQDLRNLTEQIFYIPSQASFANAPVVCVSTGLITNAISFLSSDFNAKIIDTNGDILQELKPKITDIGKQVYPGINEIMWFDVIGMQGDFWIHDNWKGKILVINGKFETTSITASEMNVLTGIIAPFAGVLENIPEKSLPCDGRAVSRYYYANLFEKIGTVWGAGDGVNTFNLPDARGATLKGVGSGVLTDNDRVGRFANNGGNSGDNVGSYQRFSIQSHTHGNDAHSHYSPPHTHRTMALVNGGWSTPPLHGNDDNYKYAWQDGGIEGTSVAINASGINIHHTGAASTRDNNIAVNYIIFI